MDSIEFSWRLKKKQVMVRGFPQTRWVVERGATMPCGVFRRPRWRRIASRGFMTRERAEKYLRRVQRSEERNAQQTA